MPELAFARIAKLSALMDERVLDPVVLTQLYLSRAMGVCKPLNAYVALREQEALAEAERSRARILAGRRLGPLDGIPIALKDNIHLSGWPTTNGFAFPSARADADARVTARLKKAGAVLLGKLNMHEGALGGTTDNPHHGPTHNPHRIGYSPGGSSGGSGAAVAAGLCAAALGTDTAGSIRLPASYCGVVGLKPSTERVSLEGVVPLSRKLDHVGPLARCVGDIAMLMPVLAEPRMAWRPMPPVSRLDGRSLCVLDNYLSEDIEPEVMLSFGRALERLRSMGARIVHRTIPDFDPAALRHALFMMVEAGAAFEHGDVMDDTPARLSAGFRRCLDYGRRMSATTLLQQEHLAARMAAGVRDCLDEVDAIVSPTTPQPAFDFQREGLTNLNTFSTLANITGCPALRVPMAIGPTGLPHGLQIMGRLGADEEVVAMAAAFETAVDIEIIPPQPFGI